MSRPTEIVNGVWRVAKPKHKYGAKPTMYCTACAYTWPAEDGMQCHAPKSKCGNARAIRFASKREFQRYIELLIQEKAGVIRDIELQPAFAMKVNGQLICKYIADYAYIDVIAGKRVVEDAKSKATRTPVYSIKKKLLKAIHGIDVVEV
jgi:hypothetical protein